MGFDPAARQAEAAVLRVILPVDFPAATVALYKPAAGKHRVGRFRDGKVLGRRLALVDDAVDAIKYGLGVCAHSFESFDRSLLC